MKIPKEKINGYGFQSIMQLIFIVMALYTHDWFYLLACYVITPNLIRIINYDGEE